MGKKRSAEDREEKIRNKIRKLESKLKQPRRSAIHSSENEDEDDLIIDVEQQQYESDDSLQLDHVFGEHPPQTAPPMSPASSQRAQPPPATPQQAPPPPATPRPASPSPARPPPRPASPVAGPSSAPDVPQGQPDADTAAPEDFELDDDTLRLLGDAPKPETVLGPNIHKDVASRWNEILVKGLAKEVKDKILQEYLVPGNCSLLIAPTLNPEAKAALPEPLVKRDFSILNKQKQLSLALAALAHAIDSIIKKERTENILKPISDACRILCDSHFYETKTRRNFVISAINTDLKDTLVNTVRDSFLFGDNVSEKLKAAKSIQKSGDTLKTSTQKTPYNSFNKSFTAKARNPKGNLNYKPQHRRPQGRSDAGMTRAQPRPARPGAPRSPPPRPPQAPPAPPPPPRRAYRK